MSTYGPIRMVADRQRCPCRSGAPYRRCCKGLVRFRQRALRELLDQACVRQQERSIGGQALLRRFRLHLARRDQELAVQTWLKSDLVALGYEVSGGWGWINDQARVHGLAWKVPSVVQSGKPRVDGSLQRALGALRQGDDAAALDELLRSWQQRRLPVIADIVEKVSTVCGVGQLPDSWPARLSDGL